MPRKTMPRNNKRRVNKRKQLTNRKYEGTLTSVNFNQASLRTKQPVPSRFFTTMSIANTGHYAAAAGASADWAFSINSLVTPFNTSPALPNPVVSVTTAQPAGLKNLLYNSGTSTGLYEFFRIWKVRVMVNYSPQAVGDTMNLVLAPSIQNGSQYSSAIQAMQGPNSMIKIVSSGNNQANNTIHMTYDMPDLLGIPRKEYEAFSTEHDGTFSSVPSNACLCGVYYQTQDNSSNSSAIGISVTVEYDVEFFQRVDSGILDTLKTPVHLYTKSGSLNTDSSINNNNNNNNCNGTKRTWFQ